MCNVLIFGIVTFYLAPLQSIISSATGAMTDKYYYSYDDDDDDDEALAGARARAASGARREIS